MARDRERSRRTAKDQTRRAKKKVCVFCAERVSWVDYKDVNLLRRFVSDRGKIRARRVTGNCAQHQREVAVAIKTARELALLPYTQRLATERGRGGRGAPAPALAVTPPDDESALDALAEPDGVNGTSEVEPTEEPASGGRDGRDREAVGP